MEVLWLPLFCSWPNATERHQSAFCLKLQRLSSSRICSELFYSNPHLNEEIILDLYLLHLVPPPGAGGCAGTGWARPQQNCCSPKFCRKEPLFWLVLGCLQEQAKGRAAVDVPPQAVVDAASVVFLSHFPPLLGSRPERGRRCAAEKPSQAHVPGAVCCLLSAPLHPSPLTTCCQPRSAPKKLKNERFRGGGVRCAQSLACAEDRTLQVPPSLWPWGPGWQLFAF